MAVTICILQRKRNRPATLIAPPRFTLRGVPSPLFDRDNRDNRDSLTRRGFQPSRYRDNTGTDRDRQAETGRNGQSVVYVPARVRSSSMVWI